ncbi:MAG TPA: gamma-glutamyltransferase [Candidatus Kapabacteria bacterium]|nr:gamma-glutamyltransferase [Candidatus Kapabacteria bacterium]
MKRTALTALRACAALCAALCAGLCAASCGGTHAAHLQHPDSLSARSALGMVTSATPEATEAGLYVLRKGGNAVDAAVAVGFALAVSYPQAGNLGGGGFMVIRMADGRTTTIDFREKAPAAATRTMFLDSTGAFVPERSLLGALASGVPGSPAGLLYALERYGTRSRRDVMAPAIALAELGIVVHPRLAEDLHEKYQDFRNFASTLRAVCPEHTAGTTTRAAGTIWIQSDLAKTLRRINDSGAAGFYSGATAEMIVRQMKHSGGLITADDLLAYRPAERAPVIGTYRGDTVITMPPPSSGGALLVEMLNMMEPCRFDTIGYHSAEHAHLLAEIMRRAYADRAEHFGDPDFYTVPVTGLTSKEYARARAATITPHATASSEIGHGDPSPYNHESQQTTHFSVVDRFGNCVSTTMTLNASFGSKLVVDGAGFFLNNEMDDFSAKPGAPNMYGLLGNEANAVAPGKRMLSSMTPTIVTHGGRPWLVLGTPGGSTIITTVLQMINNIGDYGMSLSEAVAAPRIHHQWRPDTLWYENGAFSAATIDTLSRNGYTTVNRHEPSGRVDAIEIEYNADGTRTLRGFSDGRGYGAARGE